MISWYDAWSMVTKENRESWTSSKFKIFGLQETPSREGKDNSHQEKIMESHVPDKGLYSEYANNSITKE